VTTVSVWKAIMTGEETDPGPAIAQTGETLDRLLQTRPQAERELLEVVGKRLEAPIGEKSMEALRSALTNYAGEDVSFLVLWVAQSDQASRLAQVEASAPGRVTALMRAIMGLYGAELTAAYTRWNELPDDWSRIDREIRNDLISERVLVKVRISKHTGEQVVIDGPASSILELTANMVRTCNLVGRADSFAPRAIEMLLMEINEFYNMLRTAAGDLPQPVTGETAATPLPAGTSGGLTN
jgi:hypothetical protein